MSRTSAPVSRGRSDASEAIVFIRAEDDAVPSFAVCNEVRRSSRTCFSPRRTGKEQAEEIALARLPVGTAEALRGRLIDDHFDGDSQGFLQLVQERAEKLVADSAFAVLLKEKERLRRVDGDTKPLACYRRRVGTDEAQFLRLRPQLLCCSLQLHSPCSQIANVILSGHTSPDRTFFG